ncbi:MULTISPECIES: hypothetical protein [unclassified Acidovorax]|uniref:hypothetical protein n=1 Tax=unclassified Acidovorax TaxID=2684926 RepID=UPI0021052879|nr:MULTISPECIES: hypothetical protein [unclassified Acidovorax]
MNDTWPYHNQITGTRDKRTSGNAAAALTLQNSAERPLFMPVWHPLLFRLLMVHLRKIGQVQPSHFRSI